TTPLSVGVELVRLSAVPAAVSATAASTPSASNAFFLMPLLSGMPAGTVPRRSRFSRLRAECGHGSRAAWRDRRDRRLQGLLGGAASRWRRPRGDSDPDPGGRDVRLGEDVRGARAA